MLVQLEYTTNIIRPTPEIRSVLRLNRCFMRVEEIIRTIGIPSCSWWRQNFIHIVRKESMSMTIHVLRRSYQTRGCRPGIVALQSVEIHRLFIHLDFFIFIFGAAWCAIAANLKKDQAQHPASATLNLNTAIRPSNLHDDATVIVLGPNTHSKILALSTSIRVVVGHHT